MKIKKMVLVTTAVISFILSLFCIHMFYKFNGQNYSFGNAIPSTTESILYCIGGLIMIFIGIAIIITILVLLIITIYCTIEDGEKMGSTLFWGSLVVLAGYVGYKATKKIIKTGYETIKEIDQSLPPAAKTALAVGAASAIAAPGIAKVIKNLKDKNSSDENF